MRVQFSVAQLGLAAYMFVVGLEFRLDIVRTRTHSAVAVSIAGMAAPFVLGAARATAVPPREALGIGTLMNVRGLMELIIINIGLPRGITLLRVLLRSPVCGYGSDQNSRHTPFFVLRSRIWPSLNAGLPQTLPSMTLALASSR